MGHLPKTDPSFPSPFQAWAVPRESCPILCLLIAPLGLGGYWEKAERQRVCVCVCVCVCVRARARAQASVFVCVSVLRETYNLGTGRGWGTHGGMWRQLT